ncbi:MAG: sigma-70 family RNA polymerase sigma factor [Bacteroidota bacterium]|nr:sigma-70 family RNA polymerase sigma factor [Bacteroidota bacterium]
MPRWPQRAQDDNDLLAALKKGDDKAFDQIFRIYYSSLKLFAFKLCANEQQAEDIVQECFLKLWRLRGNLANADNLKSYLYRSVKNVFLEKHEKRSSHPKELSHDIEDDSALQIVIRCETSREIYRVLQLIPPRMREVFVLYYLEGRSTREICELLHKTVNTIDSQRKRALQLFRKQFIPG